MAFHRTSIATLVVLVLVLVTSILSAAIGTINYVGIRTRMEEDLKAHLERQCNQLATALSLAAWNIDRGQVDRIIESAMKDPDLFGIVVSVAGKTHAQSRDPRWLVQTPGALEPPPGHLDQARPITFNDETIGEVRVVMSPHAMDKDLQSTLYHTVLVTIIVDLALILSLYWLLRQTVLRPLKVLQRYAVAISSGDAAQHSIDSESFQGELEILRHALGKTVLLLDARFEALEQANARLEFELKERERAEADRHKLEERLAAAQRMESIGRLAGGVAHDFNNMLAVIYGNLEFLREQIPEDSPMNEEVDSILEAANRARDITHQLLAFSRKQTIEVKPLEMNTIVERVETMLSRLLGEMIRVRIHLCAEPACVKADGSQLEQVLLNLCLNARDAMPMGGELTIETGIQQVADGDEAGMPGLKAGDYVMLAVSDTGTGMDASVACQVFEPFFTTKAVGKGTGLGLATVHGIIKQHGGEIAVYSELGIGTTFRLYLPRVNSAPVLREAVAIEPRGGQGERILVMEDDDVLRRLIGQMLERMGYKALVANTLDLAMQLAQCAGKIDLLLTDIIMPHVNGRQVYEQIREICPGLKVLYMSGYTSDIISVHGILEEGVHFVAKPFTERDLGVKIQGVLTGET